MIALVSKPIKSSAKGVASFFNKAIERGSGMLGFQHGGTVPGPVGQAVPIMAHGQERIIPAGQSAGGGGAMIVFNFNNPQVRSMEDVTVLRAQVERALRDVVRGHKLTTI